MTALRRRYGASPLHLLAHLAILPLAGWAILQLMDLSNAANVLLWFVAAVLLHDAVVWPLYSGIDRAADAASAAVDRGGHVRAINHVRVPLGLSALMFLVFFPAILERAEGNFQRVSGVPWDGHLERWLLVSFALFAGSAVLYAVRVRRARGRSSDT